MTLKETLKIAKEFGFQKRAIPTEASGCDELFHYFTLDYHGFGFIISNEGENPNVWHGSIMDTNVNFYTPKSFRDVIVSVMNGDWNGN